jgi:hypothetical protein
MGCHAGIFLGNTGGRLHMSAQLWLDGLTTYAFQQRYTPNATGVSLSSEDEC